MRYIPRRPWRLFRTRRKIPSAQRTRRGHICRSRRLQKLRPAKGTRVSHRTGKTKSRRQVKREGSMILEQFYLNCLAHASYLVGDEATHTAAVIDPQRDVQRYLEAAVRH